MKSRNWFLVGLLLLLAVALLLRQGDQRRLREGDSAGQPSASAKTGLWERFTRLPAALLGRRPSGLQTVKVASTANVTALSEDKGSLV
ncbi:MAG: hypothetical protein EBS37_16670, partial [Betaproteobacteria bacterium]|nr:hypothetical protein [Betaproteobacteria bacterium]